MKMKEIVKKYNLEFSTDKIQKFVKKRKGYRVIQYFSDLKSAQGIANYLKSKGIPAKAVRDPQEGIYVQIAGTFSNQKGARAYAKRAYKVMGVTFKVENNYYKIPYTTYRLTIKGITTEEEMKKIKAEISKYATEIDTKQEKIKD